MNVAYDNPERPPTPSFIGSYTSVHDPGPPAPYVYPGDRPVRPYMPSTSSSLGFLPPKKKKHKNPCGIKCLLVTLLALFIILSLVMIVLYFTRDSSSEKGNANGQENGQTDEKVNISNW